VLTIRGYGVNTERARSMFITRCVRVREPPAPRVHCITMQGRVGRTQRLIRTPETWGPVLSFAVGKQFPVSLPRAPATLGAVPASMSPGKRPQVWMDATKGVRLPFSDGDREGAF
jgi:hypothetical protein